MRVLIVDDEKPARELLKMRIDWAKLGFDMINTAHDGEEALNIYKKTSPILVITDIQMPIMDGLELISRIKKIKPEQRIIILSCHESFSYAKQAMKLGVTDYLIKDSFQPEEMYSLLSDIYISNLEGESKPLNPTLDFASQQLAVKTLVFEGISQDLLPEYLQKYQLSLEGELYVLLYLEIEKYKPDISSPKIYIEKQDIRKVLDVIKATLNSHLRGECCYDEKNGFIIICGLPGQSSEMKLLQELAGISSQLRVSIKSLADKNVTIGISRPFVGLAKVRNALNEGKSAVQKKIFMGYDKTFYYSDNSFSHEQHYVDILDLKCKKIESFLAEQNFQSVAVEIKDIFLQNIRGFMQYNYLKHTNWVLLMTLIKYCSGKGLSFFDIRNDMYSPWEDLMDLNTVDEMCSWFLDNVARLSALLDSASQSGYSYYVNKGIAYIKHNYSKNLSLSSIAEYLQINSAYLARIFKKETGINITDYINTTRIDTAKKLVAGTSKRFYEIAEETGFNNTQRFYELFRRYVGQSPGDYRKSENC